MTRMETVRTMKLNPLMNRMWSAPMIMRPKRLDQESENDSGQTDAHTIAQETAAAAGRASAT